ncbi:MAG TPA: hypothetical protein VGN16_12310 [Acidobacteriaceae bacterium]
MITVARDIVESPVLWIAVLFLGLLLFNLRRWNRRRKKLNAFIAKHGLREGRAWQTAPEPGIYGYFFPAGYPVWMEGWLGDVRVVAFDYELGYGRDTKLGSGVGVRRQVANLPSLAPGMKLMRNEEWTFLFTDIPLFRREKRLDPEEMERLWSELLEAPSLDDPNLMNSRPGEVHIPPRRGPRPWRSSGL